MTRAGGPLRVREPARQYVGDAGSWLPDLMTLAAAGGRWAQYVESIYDAFRADFVSAQPSFPGRRWAVKRMPMYDGKEATFWHLVSEGDDEAERLPDLRRCERIRWPRAMIDAVATDRVRVWEQVRRRNEGRVAIALPDFSYLVVLADRGESILLWTAFTVERAHQREKLRREYEAYAVAGRRPTWMPRAAP